MDVFEYIAASNPRKARRVIEEDYTWNFVGGDLAEALRQLVNNEGADAMVAVMNIHPDRDYFQNDGKSIEKKSKSCGCTGKSESPASWINASGPVSQATILGSQTNVMLLGAALLLAAAIIVKK